MIVYNNFKIKNKFKNSVIAIGNFDGVHRGHQKVLNQAKLTAKKNKLKVASLIDDNLDIEKQSFVNVKIITAKTFLKIKKQEHSKILILVCQQTIEIFDDIGVLFSSLEIVSCARLLNNILHQEFLFFVKKGIKITE